jgi:hypothetical protein
MQLFPMEVPDDQHVSLPRFEERVLGTQVAFHHSSRILLFFFQISVSFLVIRIWPLVCTLPACMDRHVGTRLRETLTCQTSFLYFTSSHSR